MTDIGDETLLTSGKGYVNEFFAREFWRFVMAVIGK